MYKHACSIGLKCTSPSIGSGNSSVNGGATTVAAALKCVWLDLAAAACTFPPRGGIPMLRMVLLCFLLAGCSSVESFHENLPPAPDLHAVAAVLKSVAAGAHLAEPVEISDPIRAPPISLSPWMICLRSGKSEESKRLTYSAFFTDKYVSSRYSAIVDHCEEQVYHQFKAS